MRDKKIFILYMYYNSRLGTNQEELNDLLTKGWIIDKTYRPSNSGNTSVSFLVFELSKAIL